MLGGRRLLRQLATKGRAQRSYDCQIPFRMGHTLRRCAHHLGIQNPDYHRFVYYGSRIHSLVHQSKGGHSFNGDTQRSNRAWGADHQRAPKNPLHGFEDNSGALELARLPKMRPRTKHINQSYHHFREHVEKQEIIVQATPTEDQIADILTKPLPETSFCRHRRSIMGW